MQVRRWASTRRRRLDKNAKRVIRGVTWYHNFNGRREKWDDFVRLHGIPPTVSEDGKLSRIRSNLALDRGDQFTQYAVGGKAQFVHFRRIGPILMTHYIVGRKAEGKQVGGVVLAELFRLTRASGRYQEIFRRKRVPPMLQTEQAHKRRPRTQREGSMLSPGLAKKVIIHLNEDTSAWPSRSTMCPLSKRKTLTLWKSCSSRPGSAVSICATASRWPQ
jgi:hypothetical protein